MYCLQRFIALFEQLASFTSTVQGIEQVAVLQQLIEEQLALETVDFSGSPISGIQILGVLETRLLDFDTVIMTDVNEGVIPAGKKQQSFLPFEVKKNYELPTFLDQDAIYTYHFYRLLHRASSCHLLYNSSASGLQTGEPSRFLAQLELLSQAHHKIEHKVLHNSSNLKLSATQEFPKTSGVVQRLSEWAQKGISPSALTIYLRDPLQFYERYVLQLKAPPTWSLVMDPRESGTLLHDVLETLYAPYRNGVLTEAQLVKMEANFEGLLLEQYRKFHSGNPNRHGKNHLIFEALKAYGKALLAYEKKQINAGHELKIIALEQEVSLSIKLASGALVRLKGIIDRVDYFDGQLRIIDYKTGKIEGADLKIKQWDAFLDTTSAAAFQLLTYALMYAQQQPLP
ncbi:MAG: PD-(D/E)XK nuclease family protein, partial [Flavobacteriales bacterium]